MKKNLIYALLAIVSGSVYLSAQAPPPPPEPPAPAVALYTASGTIMQLNYGRRGETNGFVLRDGVVALTPPLAATGISAIRPGARVSISGMSHVAETGKTIVDVQSITANGRTIALNDEPGPSPEDRPGPRDRRGPCDGSAPPRDAGAPPPPPPPAPDRQ